MGSLQPPAPPAAAHAQAGEAAGSLEDLLGELLDPSADAGSEMATSTAACAGSEMATATAAGADVMAAAASATGAALPEGLLGELLGPGAVQVQAGSSAAAVPAVAPTTAADAASVPEVGAANGLTVGAGSRPEPELRAEDALRLGQRPEAQAAPGPEPELESDEAFSLGADEGLGLLEDLQEVLEEAGEPEALPLSLASHQLLQQELRHASLASSSSASHHPQAAGAGNGGVPHHQAPLPTAGGAAPCGAPLAMSGAAQPPPLLSASASAGGHRATPPTPPPQQPSPSGNGEVPTAVLPPAPPLPAAPGAGAAPVAAAGSAAAEDEAHGGMEVHERALRRAQQQEQLLVTGGWEALVTVLLVTPVIGEGALSLLASLLAMAKLPAGQLLLHSQSHPSQL